MQNASLGNDLNIFDSQFEVSNIQMRKTIRMRYWVLFRGKEDLVITEVHVRKQLYKVTSGKHVDLTHGCWYNIHGCELKVCANQLAPVFTTILIFLLIRVFPQDLSLQLSSRSLKPLSLPL